MALTFHPRPGQILHCDFSKGFKEPEMIKENRPVLVLTQPITGRGELVTIAALSTVKPDPLMDYHLEIPRSCMPMLGRFQRDSSWLKGDMVYSIGFHRLGLIMLRTRDPRTGKRVYFNRRFSRERMKDVYGCVLIGMNLGHLVPHI